MFTITFALPGYILLLFKNNMHAAQNLRVIFDGNLCFDQQAKNVKSCFFQRLISKLRSFLSLTDSQKVVHAFIYSWLDYCNALYRARAPSTTWCEMLLHNLLLGLRSMRTSPLCWPPYTSSASDFESMSKFYFIISFYIWPCRMTEVFKWVSSCVRFSIQPVSLSWTKPAPVGSFLLTFSAGTSRAFLAHLHKFWMRSGLRSRSQSPSHNPSELS